MHARVRVRVRVHVHVRVRVPPQGSDLVQNLAGDTVAPGQSTSVLLVLIVRSVESHWDFSLATTNKAVWVWVPADGRTDGLLLLSFCPRSFLSTNRKLHFTDLGNTRGSTEQREPGRRNWKQTHALCTDQWESSSVTLHLKFKHSF